MTDYSDLTVIDGVGDDSAEALENNGFDTVEDVATADEDSVAVVDGFGPSRATEVIDAANSFLENEETESTETTEEGVDSGVETTDDTSDDFDSWSVEGTLDSGVDDIYVVELDADTQTFYHVIHVVLEEATSRHQSSADELRDSAYNVAHVLMDVLTDTSSGRISVEVALDTDELNALYRALKSGSLDYSSRAGVSSMYSDFNRLRDDVNEVRKEAISS